MQERKKPGGFPFDPATKHWAWEEEFTVTSFLTDTQAVAPLPVILKFTQETAYAHAQHLHFGYDHLRKNNTFWVLARMTLRMERYPRWRERVTVRTWASEIDGLYALRDFEIRDENNLGIGAARSAWLILAMDSRRPQRPEILREMSAHFPRERALPVKPEKIRIPDQEGDAMPYTVRYSDLDLYGHVNNTKYLEWVLDTYPAAHHETMEAAAASINFLAETTCEENVVLERFVDERAASTVFHRIRKKADQRDACLLRIEWREKKEKKG